MVNVLALDPGEEKGAGATGICYMNEHKVFALTETQDLIKVLKTWDLKKMPVDHLVVEGYMINPRQKGKIAANIGKRLVTVENIGRAEMWAQLNDIPVTIYPNTIKSTQARHSGIYPKKMRKDISHKFDAYNHGWWYLYNELGLVKTALEKEMGI